MALYCCVTARFLLTLGAQKGSVAALPNGSSTPRRAKAGWSQRHRRQAPSRRANSASWVGAPTILSHDPMPATSAT